MRSTGGVVLSAESRAPNCKNKETDKFLEGPQNDQLGGEWGLIYGREPQNDKIRKVKVRLS